MSNEELRTTVPATPPSTKALWAEMRQISAKVDRLLRAVTKDPLDPEARPGIFQVQEEHGDRLESVEGRLTKLEEKDQAAAEKWGGRAWAAFYDIAKLAGATGIGVWFGKGAPH